MVSTKLTSMSVQGEEARRHTTTRYFFSVLYIESSPLLSTDHIHKKLPSHKIREKYSFNFMSGRNCKIFMNGCDRGIIGKSEDPL